METKTFEWNPPPPPKPADHTVADQEVVQVQRRRLKRYWELTKPYAGYGALFAVLAGLFLSSKSRSEIPAINDVVEVLIPFTPIAKGEAVETETLRLVPVSGKNFTKKQILQFVREQDVTPLKGRLVAKKNLSPQQPLSWNDLAIHHRNGATALSARPVIYFGKEDSHEK